MLFIGQKKKNHQIKNKQAKLDEAKRLLLASASGNEQMISSPDGRARVIQCVKFRQPVCLNRSLFQNDQIERKTTLERGNDEGVDPPLIIIKVLL